MSGSNKATLQNGSLKAYDIYLQISPDISRYLQISPYEAHHDIYLHIYIPEKGGDESQPPKQCSWFFFLCAEVSRSPKQLSHFTGLFDYSALSLKPNSSTQKLTHRGFYIQTFLHTNIFTPKGFIHSRSSSTQTFWHTNILTQKCFYTQTCLHTDTFKNTNLFTHGPVYAYTECCTQTLLHTDAFTQKHLDTEPHLKWNGNGRFGPKPSKNPFGTRF